MGLENLKGNVFVNALNPDNPVHATDQLTQLDNHLRGIKNVLRKTFPNIAGKILRTHKQINDTFIPGKIEMYVGDTEPDGWVFCNGQAIDRTANSDLFNVFGTTFGDGDGSSTFNVPDLRDMIPVMIGGDVGLSLGGTTGAETHTLTEAETLQHEHEIDLETSAAGRHSHNDRFPFKHVENPSQSGAYAANGGGSARMYTNYSGAHSHSVNGETSSVGNGVAHNNVAPSLGINFMVKL